MNILKTKHTTIIQNYFLYLNFLNLKNINYSKLLLVQTLMQNVNFLKIEIWFEKTIHYNNLIPSVEKTKKSIMKIKLQKLLQNI